MDYKTQKELADIGRAKYGRRDNAIDTRSLKDTIMKMVATIEKQKGEMFQRAYPQLEREMWDAIDSDNAAKLHAIIKKLDELR